MSSNIYQFQASNKRRRIGLARINHSLLKVVGNNTSDLPASMPTRPTNTRRDKVKKPPAEQGKGRSKGNLKEAKGKETDIFAAPKGSSDNEASSSDEDDERGNIRPSTFQAGNVQHAMPGLNTGGKSAGTKSAGMASTRNTRTRNAAQREPGSPKRKSEEDGDPSSADIFGNMRVKKVRSSYGLSNENKRPISSQNPAAKSTQEKEGSPASSFKIPFVASTPEKKKRLPSKLLVPSADGLDSPKPSRILSDPADSKDGQLPRFDNLKDAILDSENDDDDDVKPNKIAAFADLDSPPAKFQPGAADQSLLQSYMSPATQAPNFQNYSFDGDSSFLSPTNDHVGQDKNTVTASKSVWESPSVLDVGDLSIIQAREISSSCPMCGAPVDSTDLVAAGEMTTRAQELFCRAHQRRTALTQWSERGYPTIPWDTLPSRLPKYKDDIKTWIIGKPSSHYRSLYSSALTKGGNRNLKKTTTNLIPGYYGPKGSHIISEYVMQHFSKLLRERAPRDRIISKGSVTAFVQAVIVMEIAAKLIEEDLGVDEDEARRVLDDSIAIGELLWEEDQSGKSVVNSWKSKTRADDSEHEVDDSEDELA